MRMASNADVEKAQPFTFDLGHMLCNDSNPLSTLKDNKEAVLAATAQACAQGLINQLLTACPIARSSDGDLQIKLPEPTFQLPREKPVPKEKEKTKWEKFADKKGIKAKKRDGKLVYDEAKGNWVPKYGYKGKGSEVNDDWLVEVDDKTEKALDSEPHGKGKSKRQKKG